MQLCTCNPQRKAVGAKWRLISQPVAPRGCSARAPRRPGVATSMLRVLGNEGAHACI
jgi:hypothetical protein